jgi:hypothetical protein
MESGVVGLEKLQNLLLEITVTCCADYVNYLTHTFSIDKPGKEFVILGSEF